jgi:hypothetical protein
VGLNGVLSRESIFFLKKVPSKEAKQYHPKQDKSQNDHEQYQSYEGTNPKNR